MIKQKTMRNLFLLLVLSMLAACAKQPLPGAYLVQAGQALKKIDPAIVNKNNPVYQVSPRDLLLIQVQMAKHGKSKPKFDKGNQLRIGFIADENSKAVYHLVPGDVLALTFPDEVEGSYEVTISPDGHLSLPRTSKSIVASGLTMTELYKWSIKAYRGIFLKPKLSWSLIKPFNSRLAEMSGDYYVGANGNLVIQGLGRFNVLGLSEQNLTEKLTKAASAKFKNKVNAHVSMFESVVKNVVDSRLDVSGVEMYTNVASRPSRVGDDGNLFIPTLGNIQAQGKSLNTLRKGIKAALAPRYQNPIHVNVSVQEYAENNLFIGGEVNRPGRYPFSNQLSLLKMIAYAGWANTSGDMTNVLLLRANGKDGYTIYRTNLDEVIEGKASSAQDFKLSPQDLVIVPPTDIAKKGRFVAQYIRNILPFGTNVSYNINRQGFLE